jgi:hypothetical protein
MAGGNVSDSQDMSQAVEHGLQIVEEIGCTVILIHHTGKDVTKKELGSIALRAGLDSSIFVEKSAGGIISVKPDKQKDMADGEEMNLYFSLNVVEVGSTAKGKVLTSCTLNPEDNPGNEQGARAMQEIEWNKMNMLDLLQEEGELRTTEWDSLCRERHGLTKGKVETYRRELVDSGEVTHRRDGITHYYSRPIAIPKIA